ncbi:hypothetical protein H4Q26_004692 [Puccinia striiformis f. sp. tritici PST-130]|nr:hypothetical protein H4Q26_004692 [Puccinia striiformis f. sp. tritici PST-130]
MVLINRFKDVKARQLKFQESRGSEVGDNGSVVDKTDKNDEDVASLYAPQLRVVNGQMILDQDSLEVDRRDQEVELDEMEVVEESDATRLVNSNTGLNLLEVKDGQLMILDYL